MPLWQMENVWNVIFFVHLWQIFLEYLDVSFNKITTLDGLKVRNFFTANAAENLDFYWSDLSVELVIAVFGLV